MFDKSEIGLLFPGTVFKPDLNIGKTLVNSKQLGYLPSWNTKFTSLLIIGAILELINFTGVNTGNFWSKKLEYFGTCYWQGLILI